MSSVQMSEFARSIMSNKYLHEGESGWEDIARRVVDNVLTPYFPDKSEAMLRAIVERKFMPGGRYLYASGKPLHQVQNCALFTVEDSKESIADLFRRVATTLMTGAGVGIVWSNLRPNGAKVGGMGGESTGPVAFMKAVNEIGRNIMQGGSRRSAIWAGLHWNHPDVFEFMATKDWDDITTQGKEQDFNFPAPMDMTNISIILDTEFFDAYEDENHPQHLLAHTVYWTAVEKMLEGGEPGFSVDAWENEGENLRNAPVAGHTQVLTSEGYQAVGDIVGIPTVVWTGKQWAEDVVFKETNNSAQTVRVQMTGGRIIEADLSHPFMVERFKGAGERRHLVSVDRVPASELKVGDIVQVSLPDTNSAPFDSEAYTLGWVYGDGTFNKNGFSELTLCSDESKACFEYLSGYRSANLNDGRGFIRVYFDKRWAGHMKSNVDPKYLTPSFIAGLFDADGNWEASQKRIRLSSKHVGFLHDIRRGLEALGILSHVSKAGNSTYGRSQTHQLVIAADYMHKFVELIPTKRVRPELAGYEAFRTSTVKVLSVTSCGIQPVYCADVRKEEHTFVAEGVVISNCTEITSYDDNDICNLGSINLARIESKEEFAELVDLGTLFLLCGTLYSDIPIPEIGVTREKNRRLGLGLMGLYDWLIKREYRYEPNPELSEWLEEYAKSTEIACIYAESLGVSAPVKTRAIAPTGTIGILAEVMGTGGEPVFAVGYKRRYLKGSTWHYQYVVDATAKRMLEQGIDPDSVETASDLAKDPGRRLAFQAWLQQYVDHGISSTLNLPSKEEQPFDAFEFGNILMEHLPNLRGVTVYPNGARAGQPLNAVSYKEASDWEGFEYEEVGLENACVGGVCGV